MHSSPGLEGESQSGGYVFVGATIREFGVFPNSLILFEDGPDSSPDGTAPRPLKIFQNPSKYFLTPPELLLGLVCALLDKPQIWCILIRLFMRPITPSSIQGASHNLRRDYRTGGYRALLHLLIIGGLLLLTYNKIISIRSLGSSGQDPAGQDSEISNNFEDYYPGELEGGLLGMLRMARRPPQSSGRDVE